MRNFKSKDLTTYSRADGEAESLEHCGHSVNFPHAIIHSDTLHLLDDISSLENLKAAFKKVHANKGAPGIDKVSVQAVKDNLLFYLNSIQIQLKTMSFKPSPVKRVLIPKPSHTARIIHSCMRSYYG